MSVCRCVLAISFEPHDLWPTYLACWFNVTPSRSNSMVKVRGEIFKVTGENVPFHTCMHVTRWHKHSESPEGSIKADKALAQFKTHNDWLVGCRVLFAKVVVETTSKCFLVLYNYGSMPRAFTYLIAGRLNNMNDQLLIGQQAWIKLLSRAMRLKR